MTRTHARGFSLVETLVVMMVLIVLVGIGVTVNRQQAAQARMDMAAHQQAAYMAALMQAAGSYVNIHRAAWPIGEERTLTPQQLIDQGLVPASVIPVDPAYNPLGQAYEISVKIRNVIGNPVQISVGESGVPTPDAQARLFNLRNATANHRRRYKQAVQAQLEATHGELSVLFENAINGLTNNRSVIVTRANMELPVRSTGEYPLLYAARGYAEWLLPDLPCRGPDCIDADVDTATGMVDCEVVTLSTDYSGASARDYLAEANQVVACPAGKRAMAQFPLCMGGVDSRGRGRSSHLSVRQLFSTQYIQALTQQTPVGLLRFVPDARVRVSDVACGGGCDPALHPVCSVANVPEIGCRDMPLSTIGAHETGDYRLLQANDPLYHPDTWGGPSRNYSGTAYYLVPPPGTHAVTIPNYPPGTTAVDTLMYQTIELNGVQLRRDLCFSHNWRYVSTMPPGYELMNGAGVIGGVGNRRGASGYAQNIEMAIRYSPNAALCCREPDRRPLPPVP